LTLDVDFSSMPEAQGALMTIDQKWMPVFSVLRSPKVVHAAHPDVTDAKRREQKSDLQDYWQRVGTALANVHGGFTIRLTALPLDGTLVVRPAEAHERFDLRMEG
jgi:hypothetical protein